MSRTTTTTLSSRSLKDRQRRRRLTEKGAHTMAGKAKARVVIARLVSTAGTGYIYTTRRQRVAERLSMMKYDPVIKKHVLFRETKGGSTR